MTFVESIKSFFKNYTKFSGRASRSEFWYAQLFVFIVGSAIDAAFPAHMTKQYGFEWPQYSALQAIWNWGTLVPSLAIGWRRLHDVNRSGHYYWWLLLPVIGWILVLVQHIKRGTDGANRFGEPVVPSISL
jgi:uncharacterized membrane protein YhaH (DUF805 family)